MATEAYNKASVSQPCSSEVIINELPTCNHVRENILN